jgi:hypothetical protein
LFRFNSLVFVFISCFRALMISIMIKIQSQRIRILCVHRLVR